MSEHNSIQFDPTALLIIKNEIDNSIKCRKDNKKPKYAKYKLTQRLGNGEDKQIGKTWANI